MRDDSRLVESVSGNVRVVCEYCKGKDYVSYINVFSGDNELGWISVPTRRPDKIPFITGTIVRALEDIFVKNERMRSDKLGSVSASFEIDFPHWKGTPDYIDSRCRGYSKQMPKSWDYCAVGVLRMRKAIHFNYKGAETSGWPAPFQYIGRLELSNKDKTIAKRVIDAMLRNPAFTKLELEVSKPE